MIRWRCHHWDASTGRRYLCRPRDDPRPLRRPEDHAAALLTVAVPAATHAAAEHLLAASQPLVPVDKGDLKASGRVEQEGTGARVIYDAVSPEGYPYGIRQHEDMTLHHPHGGQAKFLEQPFHTEARAIAVLIASTLRRWLGR
jgi:hypothetical protein